MHLFFSAAYQINQKEIILPGNIAKTLGEFSTAFLEVVGILVIIFIAVHALIRTISRFWHSADEAVVFQETRHRLIRGILLGLDFLVAADIIRTVAVELSFASIGVLAVIVVIRILLSFSLEVEMTGSWPWQKRHE